MSRQQSIGLGLRIGLLSIVGVGLSSAGCSSEGFDSAPENVGTVTSAVSHDDAIATDGTEAEDLTANRYFVRLKKGVAKMAETGPMVAEVGTDLQAKHGGKVRRVYKHAVQALAMELSASELAKVKADPQVEYVEPVPVRQVAATQYNPESWGLDRIDQRQLPPDYQYTYPNSGANIVHVYVLDTGAYAQHNAFGGRVTGGWDFMEDTSDTRERARDGHGTHVAGTIGSSTWGVAKQVQIHPLRVCGYQGSSLCDVEAEVDAIEWMTHAAQHPAVANMSFHGHEISQTEIDAVNAAIAQGITMVACAGNSKGDACIEYPGAIPGVISVASVDSTNTRASDSSYGSCVDLFAPGDHIVSAGVAQDTSATLSGTSMAAPHVTGVAALYLALNPKATPSEVTAAILAQATPGIVNDPQGSPNLMLYEGFLNAGPCDGLCSNPTNFNFPFNGNYQSGNLGRGSVCRATTSPVTGGNCGNFTNGRTLKVNGVTKTCNNQNWATVPPSRNGGYCIQTTSGDYSYAYFTLWSSL